MKRDLVPIYLKLPKETNQRISELAQANGYSKCAYIRQIIRNYLRWLDYGEEYELDWEVKSALP